MSYQYSEDGLVETATQKVLEELGLHIQIQNSNRFTIIIIPQ